MSNGSADLDYSGNGTLDTKISFGMDVTIDYSASGPLGSNIVTMDQGEPMPGYVHVSAEFDQSASMQAYNASLTSSNIGLHDNVKRIDWTSTPGLHRHKRKWRVASRARCVRSDAFLSNFALGSDASATDSLGNIASHELNITKPDGTEIATGTVHGMAAQ